MTTIEWLLAALLGSTALTSIPAQEHDRPTDKPAAGTAAKPATVFVVARSHGRYEVMTKEALKARNKQISDDYAKAVQQHAKEKAAAKRAHKKATGAEPKKAPLLEAVGEYPTREAAEAVLKTLEEQKTKAHDEGSSKRPAPKPKQSGPGN